jgi:hypothetical protein
MGLVLLTDGPATTYFYPYMTIGDAKSGPRRVGGCSSACQSGDRAQLNLYRASVVPRSDSLEAIAKDAGREVRDVVRLRWFK